MQYNNDAFFSLMSHLYRGGKPLRLSHTEGVYHLTNDNDLQYNNINLLFLSVEGNSPPEMRNWGGLPLTELSNSGKVEMFSTPNGGNPLDCLPDQGGFSFTVPLYCGILSKPACPAGGGVLPSSPSLVGGASPSRQGYSIERELDRGKPIAKSAVALDTSCLVCS